MLLYLSTPNNEALFSNTLEQQGVFMDYIDITRYPTLIAALSRNRALPNYEHIVFHFDAPPVVEPVLAAAAHIRRFHHARIIVFAPQCTETTEVFAALSAMGLRELVAVNAETDLLAELQECISQDGKGYLNSVEITATAGIEAARVTMRPQLSIPQGKYVTAGIAGTQERTGVTTQAFAAYYALKALGAVPCIVTRKQGFAQLLAALYPDEFEANGSLSSIRGVVFANDIQIGTEHNVFLMDYGILAPDIAQDYGGCDIRLLCSGAKPWEFPQLVATLKHCPDAAQRVVFSFVASKEEKDVRALVANAIPADFAPWSPDIWNSASDWHEQFWLPLIKEVVG